jgi:hypothetical protein
MTTALLQLEHYFRQTLVGYLIFDLLLVGLGNLIVLTVDTAQVAIAEEDVAGAFGSHQRRFFAEMRRVRRDDRQPARIAGRDFILQSVVETIARTDGALFQQRFQRRDAMVQLACAQQAKVSRLGLC